MNYSFYGPDAVPLEHHNQRILEQLDTEDEDPYGRDGHFETTGWALIPVWTDGGKRIGTWAWIDLDLHSELDAFKWRLSEGYAVRNAEDGYRERMHRRILGLERGDERVADHINRDRLDNRRANLRIVTRRENGQNVTGRPGTSRYRGVNWNSQRQCWVARVTVDRHAHQKYTATEEEARDAAIALRREHYPLAVELDET